METDVEDFDADTAAIDGDTEANTRFGETDSAMDAMKNIVFGTANVPTDAAPREEALLAERKAAEAAAADDALDLGPFEAVLPPNKRTSAPAATTSEAEDLGPF